MWDQPNQFLDSQAYGKLYLMNLAVYLEEVRSATLYKARRYESPSGSHSTAAHGSNAHRVTEITAPTNEQQAGTSTASTSVARDVSSSFTDQGREPASTDGYMINASMVYEEDDIDNVAAPSTPHSPKGKKKAVDPASPRESCSSSSVESSDQDYQAARQASIMQYLGSRYQGEAGPSKPYELLRSRSSNPSSSEHISEERSSGTVSVHKASIVNPMKTPVVSMQGVIETVSDAEDDGNHTDCTAYDWEKSPRVAPPVQGQEDNDACSKASSPLVSPVSANFKTAIGEQSEEPLSFAAYLQHTPMLYGTASPRGSPMGTMLPASDTATSLVIDGKPLPNLPDEESFSDVDLGEIRQPVPQSNDLLFPDMAQALAQLPSDVADINPPVTHHISFPAPAFDLDILPSSRYVPPSHPPPPPPPDHSDPVFYNPNDPLDPFQSTRVAPPPLQAHDVAAVAAQRVPASFQETPAFLAQPFPHRPGRTGLPSLAKTPSTEFQSMYRDAIRDGTAVLHAPPAPAAVDVFPGAGRRRRSAVGLIRPVTPKMEAEEDATWWSAPGSAPPFPSGRRRPFEEVAVKAVCFCLETGRLECECPGVVEPAVWM
jgi:hypothetical protein